MASALAAAGCGGGDAHGQDPIPGVLEPQEWPEFEAVVSETAVFDGDPDRQCRSRWKIVFHAVDSWTATRIEASDGAGCVDRVAALEQDANAVWEVSESFVDGTVRPPRVRRERSVRASSVGRLAPHPVFAVAFPKVPYGDYLGAEVERSDRVVVVTEAWCADEVCSAEPTVTASKRFTLRPDGLPGSVEVDGPGTASLQAKVERLTEL